MSAAIVGVASVNDQLWQLALWPPDTQLAPEIALHRTRRTTVRRVVVVAEAERVVMVFPCTWPRCSRGVDHPFDSAAQLANHRFAAHGIRSTNEESIKRQERRDRQRAKTRDASVPEYIDQSRIRAQIAKLLPVNLPPDVRSGVLDPGEREKLRRRLCHIITTLPREIPREPAEIAVAIAELIAAGLAPVGLAARVLNPIDALSTAPPSSKRGKK